MEVDIINQLHEKVGTIELPDEIFAAEVSEGLLWDVVQAQRASHRSGTHATKKRGEVSGGGIKPYRQKSTGRARQGSTRAPNHVGGGTVFGPQPRDYSYRPPRSARRAALRSALSARTREQELLVVDELPLDAPKTKSILGFLRKLGHPSVLVADVENSNLLLSMRNLQDADYIEACAVNVYDILRHRTLILTRAAVSQVVKKARKKAEVPDQAA